MAKLKDLVVAIGANTTDFDKKLGKSMYKMRSFGKNMKQLGQNMTRSVSLPILAVAGGAVKAASDLETLQTSFISLAGGAEQAGKLMSQINDFTAKTPFQIEQVGNAARQLIAAGTPIEGVNKRLQFLGDIAATSGSSIEEIASIFSKVQAKGKVELESLNQLAERGIPIFTALSEATGLPADALGAGAVSVEQFNEVLSSFAKEGGFAAGAMERLSQTAAGKLSTALDNLKLAGADLVKSLMPVLKDVIDKVTLMAQRFASLDDHQKKIILTVGLVVAALGPLATSIMSVVQAFTLLSGPVGLVVAGIGLFAGAVALYGASAKDADEEVKKLKKGIEGLNDAEAKRFEENRLRELTKELEEERKTYEALKNQVLTGDAVERRVHQQTVERHRMKIDGLQESIGAIKQEIDNKEWAAIADERLVKFAEDKAKAEGEAADELERQNKAITKEHTIGFLLSGQEQMSEQVQTERGMARAEARPGKEHTLGFLFGGLEAQSMEVSLQQATDAHAAAVDAMRVKQEQFRGSVQQMAGTLQSSFSNLFRGLMDGTQSFGEFMKQVLTDLLIKLASMAAAFLVISALIPGGGAALGGFGGFLKGGFGLTGFADGGIVSGPTAALVGEYSGARTNPEVIAPLDKLQSMIQGAGGGNVTVTGRLSGSDILLSSERSNIYRNRVRGY